MKMYGIRDYHTKISQFHKYGHPILSHAERKGGIRLDSKKGLFGIRTRNSGRVQVDQEMVAEE